MYTYTNKQTETQANKQTNKQTKNQTIKNVGQLKNKTNDKPR